MPQPGPTQPAPGRVVGQHGGLVPLGVDGPERVVLLEVAQQLPGGAERAGGVIGLPLEAAARAAVRIAPDERDRSEGGPRGE